MCCGSAPARRSRPSTRATASGCAASPRSAAAARPLTVERQLQAARARGRICGCCSRRSSARGSIGWSRRRPSSAPPALLPVWTARTQVERVNLERLRGACDRGGRAERAAVGARAARRRSGSTACSPPGRPSGRLIVCDESGGGEPIAERAGAASARAGGRCWSARKAGSTETELDALGKLSFVTRRRARPEGVARRDRRSRRFGGVPGDRRRLAPRPDPLIALAHWLINRFLAGCRTLRWSTAENDWPRRARQERRSPTSGSSSSISKPATSRPRHGGSAPSTKNSSSAAPICAACPMRDRTGSARCCAG